MKFKVQKIQMDDDDALIRIKQLCVNAGLPRSAEVWGDVRSIFSILNRDGEHVATARLEIAHDRPFVEAVAVREDLRKKGLGKMVVNAVVDEAEKRKIKTIWVMTRAPDFFKAIGFQPETDLKFCDEIIRQECMNCENYLKDCSPMLMRKEIGS